MKKPQKLLRDIFGFDEFRLGQREIIDAVSSKKNVLAIMPTGGGKSLCFQLPALMSEGLTVVISPLLRRFSANSPLNSVLPPHFSPTIGSPKSFNFL